MPTEDISARFADLDLWTTGDAVHAMVEDQLAAVAAVQSQAARIVEAAEQAAIRLSGAEGRLIYVGAGTSGRIAVQDGVELGPTFDWDRVAYLLAGGWDALRSSVEGAEDDAEAADAAMRNLAPTSHDVVIGVAASGRTAYTLAAVRTAAAAGALTVGLANNAGTPLLEAVDHPILLDTGAEVIGGSTRMKAGTAQKIALNLFSTAVMLRLGRADMGLMIDMRLSNRKLRDRAVRIVARAAGVEDPVAADALEKAGSNIKLAVLIAHGRSRDEGSALLRAAGGKLRAAIEQAKSQQR
ncbi:MAG TPA: N-acetylmuramic acid 6-phosphate etherase [Candidatus Limnocylindrales bacterium]|nr:N-acetylmuramic acid 6-phosphate etherase [Candidatus Limnocylindrales bacterium]